MRLSQSLLAYCYLKMPKFLQCHHQPGAPQKRPVPSVNDHPTTVDIFQKLYENGPCIQTISFRVIMIKSKTLIFQNFIVQDITGKLRSTLFSPNCRKSIVNIWITFASKIYERQIFRKITHQNRYQHITIVIW